MLPKSELSYLVNIERISLIGLKLGLMLLRESLL